MVKIRVLNSEDIESAIEITNKEDWGYTRRDFENALYSEPNGCFVASTDDEIIGLTTTINYGKMGWIGNVVVREVHRGKDIGKMLVVHSTGYLKARGVRAVKLNSYLNNIGFYSRIGFEEEGRCIVFSHQGPLDESKYDQTKSEKTDVRKMEKDDLKAVLSLDKVVFGFDREKPLQRTFEDYPRLCHVTSNQENEIMGFVLGIGSPQIAEIGPWICSSDIKHRVADTLLTAAVRDSDARAILVVVPGDNNKPISMLDQMGFKREFEVATMRLGESVAYGQPGGVFALGSLAHG